MPGSIATLKVRPMSRLFKALGDETRIRILALLSHRKLCVGHIENALGLSQSNASRQLAVLRHAGIVESLREGNWVYYRLAPQTDAFCKQQLRTLVERFARHHAVRQDVERVLKVKGPRGVH